MKQRSDDENETMDLKAHTDQGQVIITHISKFNSMVAMGLTQALKAKVQSMHGNPANHQPNDKGNILAQTFEEGEVALVVEPVNQTFPADVYIMDFFDVATRGVCSRMHKHTGLRSVFIITGPDTIVSTSSLSPLEIKGPLLGQIDELPGESGISRYTVTVPPNNMVSVQIPTGVSHQFNATGPNAVIISTHIEEMIEVDREKMTRPNMTAQTIFLQHVQPDSAQCVKEAPKATFSIGYRGLG